MKKILQSLYKFLNLTHGINKDYNYWNFIIGPWLVNFLQVVHDRWTVFENQSEIFGSSNLYTLLIDIDEECVTPKEIYFGKHFLYQDLWNHYVFGEIIKFQGKIEYKLKDIYHENLNQSVSKQKSIQFKTPRYLKVFNLISSLFYNKKN